MIAKSGAAERIHATEWRIWGQRWPDLAPQTPSAVIDMARGEPVANVDTPKNQGLNPNGIVLLPQRQ